MSLTSRDFYKFRALHVHVTWPFEYWHVQQAAVRLSCTTSRGQVIMYDK